MLNFLEVYKNKRVFITGNTGFKGSWLSYWLLDLGANIYGYALKPTTSPSLFDQLDLGRRIAQDFNDIRNLDCLTQAIRKAKPEIIFHLAAQPLVRESYKDPIYTIETNVMGTANVLEAVRLSGISTSIVVVTSDKCYENKEWIHGYRENDPMGGYDPYSVSKGAAELIVSAWSRSFFNNDRFPDHGVKLATARAGNVIGGGDWAQDRIVPDCMRYLQRNEKILIRNPWSTRPWQHVLESLGGYLLLGSKLISCQKENLEKYCTSFNFGPLPSSNRKVQSLVDEILKNTKKGSWTYQKEAAMHEAYLLNLSIDKAFHTLNWMPVWDFEKTVKETVRWYEMAFNSPGEIQNITSMQIKEYSESYFNSINN